MFDWIDSKMLAGVLGFLVPVAIASTAVYRVSSREDRRKIFAVSLVCGLFGTLAGYGIGHQVYWQSHGTDLPWVYTVPGALLGGFACVALVRISHAIVQAVADRTASENARQT
ncbi:MAG: hypothetical protein VB858_22910 [Planctomycetaceae bacterium]|jgi:nitrate/nitrite transporter NarK